ncbi:MAG: peptide chain release factor N(5)-glutamine methyltransferase [Firmicutes bacterium]|nr:peptide chain release factor N(5)-glutamine methyltransferase [Bacillota bacterium]
MKTRVLIKEGEYRLSKAGVEDAAIDAEELYCFMKGCDKVILFLNKEQEADKETEKEYFELIEKRASRIPLQHITGKQEFMGFDFKVGPDVLIPRQETEVLVTEAAKILRDERKTAAGERHKSRGKLFGLFSSPPEQKVLDLCCGSGAIGISLAKICEDVSVTAADISEAALALARENAKANRVEIEFLKGDLFEAVAAAEKGKRIRSFDMIISNPPYIKSSLIALLQNEVKDHEPVEALDGGSDGLDFYRRIAAEAYRYLDNDGWLMLEIGYDQGESLREIIKETGRYTEPEILKDLAGRDRVVKCRKL